ncbi:DUF3147 family protein [Bacillus sp. 03113]|uniref:DUF3147 family protein n=1 Tax=Bacillus sp. 03113 TaxID=2578211 RepID=UPI001142A0E2|nr:DUF3147 family protein [Bacillus sp. 03113]
MDKRELFLRFLFGGSAVMISYVVSNLIPWKMLGGIFAAFPAVMIVAVLMVGIRHGSNMAAQIAQGSVYGMIGCGVCVIAVLLLLQWTHNWWMSIILGAIVWFVSSILILKTKEAVGQRQKHIKAS